MNSKLIIKILLIMSILFAPARGVSAKSTIVVDNSGRRITVSRPFQRIISLYGAHTVNLLSLGLRDEIVGVSRADKRIPELKDKPILSYHDGPERFLSRSPDLVLIRPMIERGYTRLINALERSGIHVASFQVRDIEGMFRYWMALGMLTGREKQARMMITQFKRGLEEILRRSSRIEKKKRVFFESIHSKVKTFSPKSISMFSLESAGGINIARDARTVRNTNIAEYGKERLLSRAEEIDVYLSQVGPMNHVTVDMILNEPGFQIIKAIRERKVYLIEEELVSRPTMNLLKGIRRISKYLYPDMYQD